MKFQGGYTGSGNLLTERYCDVEVVCDPGAPRIELVFIRGYCSPAGSDTVYTVHVRCGNVDT